MPSLPPPKMTISSRMLTARWPWRGLGCGPDVFGIFTQFSLRFSIWIFFFEFFLDLNCLFVTRGLWAHGPSWEREKFPARFVFRSHCALKLIFSFFLARRLSLYDFFSDFSLRALLGARDSGGALASTLQRSHATRPHFDSLRILRFFLNFLRFFLLLCVRPAACLIEFYLAAGKKFEKYKKKFFFLFASSVSVCKLKFEKVFFRFFASIRGTHKQRAAFALHSFCLVDGWTVKLRICWFVWPVKYTVREAFWWCVSVFV